MSNAHTIELTEQEEKAIRSLERLAKKWPDTLVLFAGMGLSVRKPINGNYDVNSIVADIIGIPCDGGDGGDTFKS